VQLSVKIVSELEFEINKRQNYNNLHPPIFTGHGVCNAPIVCVDIYGCSVKVDSVDG
jgi:hypothetical protein